MVKRPHFDPASILGLVLAATLVGCYHEPPVVIQFPTSTMTPPPEKQVQDRTLPPGDPGQMNISK